MCVAACAGPLETPVLPTGPALRLVSGQTGEPVSGAAVWVQGTVYRSDALGRVPIGLEARADLDVSAEHFLPRQTSLAGGPVVSLWPTGPDYPADYVRHLLYKPSYTTRDGASAAQDEPLHRVVAALVTIVPEPALWADPEAVWAHQQAVEAINGATEGLVRFELRPTRTTGVVFRAHLDGSLPPGGALTYRELRQDVIVGGRIAYAGLDAARRVHYVAHELGHALGLQHSTVPSDMMYYVGLSTSPVVFTENERLSIRLLLQRKPGNRFPDNDRGSTVPGISSSAATGASLAVD